MVELRQIKVEQPELATAVDMQLALVDMQRRVQGRVPLPWIQVDPEWMRTQQAAGRPLVRFSDIPLEWSDFRLTFRQTADILQRFDALDRADHQKIVAMGRDGNALEPLVTSWYNATSGVDRGGSRRRARLGRARVSLDQVLVLALRPFLARSRRALVQQVDLSGWTSRSLPDLRLGAGLRGHHAEQPIAGWSAGDAWRSGGLRRSTCPFCSNDDRALITSFATRDGRYRVYACDVCRRYLKAYDARRAQRPVMVAVDTIATLPLDAAAMQRGYNG